MRLPVTPMLRSTFIATVAAVMISSMAALASTSPTLQLLGKTYKLGSYNQNARPMWEFTAGGQTVNNWTTLVTVIDRPDVKSNGDVDKLAEGMVTGYRKAGATVLLTKTFRDPAGKPYDYLVAAFNEPDHHRMEINYAKLAMGTTNGYIQIYAVRVTGPGDYRKASATFVTKNSETIGKALDHASAPDTSTWPRKTF